MPMSVKDGEDQATFMERCVPDLMGDDKRPNKSKRSLRA